MIIHPSRRVRSSALCVPNVDAQQVWHEYVNQLGWGPGCRDQSAWNAFLRAGSLGINPDAAIKEVATRIKASGGAFNPSKLQNQLRRAYEHVGCSPGVVNALAKPPKTEFSPEQLKRIAAAAPHVDESWLPI